MKWYKKKREKRESKGELESEYAKLAKERERLQLKQELKERQREISRLKHPYQEETRKGAKRVGGRLLRFAGGLAKEGVRSYGKTKTTLKRRRISVRRTMPRRTFTAPEGQDISLSSAIARSDWAGGGNVMSTDFFGSELEKSQKDFFGEKKIDELVTPRSNDLISSGSKKKQKYI